MKTHMETTRQREAREDLENLFEEPLKNFGGLVFWVVVIAILLS